MSLELMHIKMKVASADQHSSLLNWTSLTCYMGIVAIERDNKCVRSLHGPI